KVTVAGNGGSCVAGTLPNGNAPYNWEVVEGGSYTMTISNVTECTDNTITVFVQHTPTQGEPGNFCFVATLTSPNTYTGTFTMPNPGCFTYPISYSCGSVCGPNPNKGTYDARGPNGECNVHLRASTFGAGCTNPVPDENCQGCTITCPPDVLNLQCGASTDPASTGSATCGGPGCSVSYIDASAGGCTGKDLDRTWTCTDASGNKTSCTQHIKFVDTTKPVLSGVPAGADLGCNPTPPRCSTSVTASDNCDSSVTVTCDAGPITGTCNKSQTFTYSATDKCGNKASQDVTYTWKEDTTKPVFDNLPTGGDLGCNPTPPTCSTS